MSTCEREPLGKGNGKSIYFIGPELSRFGWKCFRIVRISGCFNGQLCETANEDTRMATTADPSKTTRELGTDSVSTEAKSTAEKCKNCKEKQGATPLLIAVLNGHVRIVQMLLRHPDIDVHMRAWEHGKHGIIQISALELAKHLGHEEIAAMIISHDLATSMRKGECISAFQI